MNRQALILSNKTEYGDRYGQIRFVDKERAKHFAVVRSHLLDEIRQVTEVCAGGSKIHYGPLSPGCRLCVEGKWSCLFINNKCNAHCFYCPSSQDDYSQPATGNLIFRKTADYISYLDEFGFKGVSFSGGEPLLSFDRTLDYLRAVRKRFDREMHVWMYTNGILLTPEKATILASEGLDEIRFDLPASGYRLDKLKMAAGKIPVVTVEIPVIPEDAGLLKSRMPEMRSEGVDHLNLHQLRLTPYNFSRLTRRDYTFLHGVKVTVLESELTALELLRHGADRNVGLPVNYCSFVYKNRYQALAERKRYLGFMKEPWEVSTPGGYLRSVSVPDMPDSVSRKGAARITPMPFTRGDRSFLTGYEQLDDSQVKETLTLSYQKVSLKQNLSYYFPYRELHLKSGMSVFLEKQPVFRHEFSGFGRLNSFLTGKSGQRSKMYQQTMDFERMPEGLADYF